MGRTRTFLDCYTVEQCFGGVLRHNILQILLLERRGGRDGGGILPKHGKHQHSPPPSSSNKNTHTQKYKNSNYSLRYAEFAGTFRSFLSKTTSTQLHQCYSRVSPSPLDLSLCQKVKSESKSFKNDVVISGGV